MTGTQCFVCRSANEWSESGLSVAPLLVHPMAGKSPSYLAAQIGFTPWSCRVHGFFIDSSVMVILLTIKGGDAAHRLPAGPFSSQRTEAVWQT